MANVKDVLVKTTELKWKIDSLLRLSTYNDYDDLSGLDIDYDNPDELFLVDELKKIMEQLRNAQDRLQYLARPIKETSRIYRSESDRYETLHGHYYTCGSRIEALVSDNRHDSPYWTRTSVEYDGSDYYLAGHKGVDMDGLTVRVREAV